MFHKHETGQFESPYQFTGMRQRSPTVLSRLKVIIVNSGQIYLLAEEKPASYWSDLTDVVVMSEFVDDSCANTTEAAEGIIRYIQSTYVVTTEIFLCSETEHDFSHSINYFSLLAKKTTL